MPFCVLGLLSTLCTAFHALIGMLLRGGKTAEGREFCKISVFYLQLFCMLWNVCNFHLSISFVDLRSVRVDFSLDLVRIARYGTRFSRMFWKITVWMQSATDDPEFVSPSMGHQILHQ